MPTEIRVRALVPVIGLARGDELDLPSTPMVEGLISKGYLKLLPELRKPKPAKRRATAKRKPAAKRETAEKREAKAPETKPKAEPAPKAEEPKADGDDA